MGEERKVNGQRPPTVLTLPLLLAMLPSSLDAHPEAYFPCPPSNWALPAVNVVRSLSSISEIESYEALSSLSPRPNQHCGPTGASAVKGSH